MSILSRFRLFGALLVFCGSTQSLTAQVGAHWQTVYPSLSEADFLAAAASPSRTVAVGNNTIAHSADGLTWTVLRVEGARLDQVAWSGTEFLAGASSGPEMVRSPDGVNWQRFQAETPCRFNDLLWNGSAWIAVGSFSGGYTQLVESTDGGKKWRPFGRALANRYEDCSLLWTGSMYVVGGSRDYRTGTIATSLDGSHWSESLVPVPQETYGAGLIHSMVWTGDRIVALGARIYTSTDGVIWDETVGPGEAEHLLWTGTEVLALGDYSLMGRSTDGITWTIINNAEPIGFYPRAALVRPTGDLLAAGWDGQIAISADGMSWTRQSGDDAPVYWVDVAQHDQSRYVAVGGGGNAVWSDNGRDWNAVSLPISAPTQIVWTGTKFLVSGPEAAAESVDGVTWSTEGLDQSVPVLNDVAAFEGLLVGVGQPWWMDGHAWWSEDEGATWQEGDVPTGSLALEKVTRHQGLWLAGGRTHAEGGIIFTSSNGKTWKKATMPKVEGIICIASSGSIVVAGTYRGEILYSTNGTVWSVATVPDAPTNVTPLDRAGPFWVGERFIAYRDGYRIESTDGKKWNLTSKGYAGNVLWDGSRAIDLSGSSLRISDALPIVTIEPQLSPTFETDGQVEIIAHLSQSVATAVSVPVTFQGTASETADFTCATPSLNFAPGKTETRLILELNDDAGVEPEELLVVVPSAGTGYRVVPDDVPLPTVRIIDDDGPPTVNLGVSRLQVGERTAGVGIHVTLSWAPKAAVEIPLALSGTAQAGADFVGVPATLTFSPGERRKTIRLQVTDDTEEEGTETVHLELGNPLNAVLGETSVCEVEILDDDGPNADWTENGSRMTVRFMNGLASSPLRQVVIDRSGLLYSSDDEGQTWTRRQGAVPQNPQSSRTEVSNHVIWTGSEFLVVGTGGTVLSSDDGVIWAQQIIDGGAAYNLTRVATGGGKTVVAANSYDAGVFDTGETPPRCFCTADGIRWSSTSIPVSSLFDVVWTGTNFVALGANWTSANTWTNDFETVLLESADGLHWQVIPSADLTDTGGYRLVVAAGDLIVLDRSGSPSSLHVHRGSGVWEARTIGRPAVQFRGGAWNGSTLLLSGPTSAVSDDVGTWAIWRTLKQSHHGYAAQVWLSDHWLAAAEHRLASSVDGLQWIHLLPDAEWKTTSNYALYNATWTGTQYVASGSYGHLFSTDDSFRFDFRNLLFSEAPDDVAWSGKTLVSVNFSGHILTSPNGTKWTRRSFSKSGLSSYGPKLRSVTWTGGQFVAVGGGWSSTSPGSIILTSPDGVKWQQQEVPSRNSLSAVAANGRIILAFGDNSTILRSEDGIHWSRQTCPISNATFATATWGGGRFVAIANKGTKDLDILWSEEGLTWHIVPTSQTPRPLVPSEVMDVEWTAAGFVAVGNNGFIMTSPDGEVWTQRDSGSASELHALASSGITTKAVGSQNAVLTARSLLAAGTPSSIYFDSSASTLTESDDSVRLLLRAEPPPTAKIVLNIQPSGSITFVGKDRDVGPLQQTITLLPGEGKKLISLPLVHDSLEEGNETSTLALSIVSGNAILNVPSSHQLTITDDDLQPIITTLDTIPRLLHSGQDLILGPVTATGTGILKYQWLKDGRPIRGATTQGYMKASCTVTDAGTYSVMIGGAAGSVPSAAISVGILDASTEQTSLKAGANVSFVQKARGSDLTFTWLKDGVVLTDMPNHLAGTSSPILKLTRIEATDAGDYQCRVTQTTSGETLIGSLHRLGINSSLPPPVAKATLPEGRVGQPYHASVYATDMLSSAPGQWKASSLPSGLRIHPHTGIISGIPLVGTTQKPVTLHFTTAAGSSSSATEITILPLSETLRGAWSGLVARDGFVNENLGSRLELTVAPSGAFSGKLVTGITSQAFKGTLWDSSASGLDGNQAQGQSIRLILPGSQSLEVEIDLRPAGSNDGWVRRKRAAPIQEATAALHLWKKHQAPAAYAGRFVFHLLPQPIADDSPQGTGYGAAVVAKNGRVSIAGQLGNASPFVCTTTVGELGQLLLYSPFDRGAGTLTGRPLVSLDFNPSAIFYPDLSRITDSESTNWFRKSGSAARSQPVYPNGWEPQQLVLQGSRYQPATGTQIPLYLPSTESSNYNATLSAKYNTTPEALEYSRRLSFLPKGRVTDQFGQFSFFHFNNATGFFSATLVDWIQQPDGSSLKLSIPITGQAVQPVWNQTGSETDFVIGRGVCIIPLHEQNDEVTKPGKPKPPTLKAGNVELIGTALEQSW